MRVLATILKQVQQSGWTLTYFLLRTFPSHRPPIGIWTVHSAEPLTPIPFIPSRLVRILVSDGLLVSVSLVSKNQIDAMKSRHEVSAHFPSRSVESYQ